ncbi:MAG: ABC transporter substrate-binding protein [Sphaerochaetaceae bacterium]|nr:ABC transporter substrate-binding protein [Sphaerochaetaceae bacterium]
MKKTLLVLFVALSVASFAFATGSQEASSSSSGSAYRDHFYAAISTKPASLNPGNNAMPIINDLVYDELIHYNKVTKEFEPCLAISWEWLNADATACKLVLRQGIKFHNGNPFTAADVEFTLTQSGANANVKIIDHVNIIDDYTIELYLNQGDADYFSKLSNTLYAGVLDKESCEADPENGYAIGTGPWVYDLDNTILGDTYEFKRNDAYWGEVAPSKLLTLRYIKDASSRLIALQNDEVQAIMEPNATDVEKIKADKNLEYCLGTGVGPAKLYYIGFNMLTGKAKDNVYLRQAIACAMDVSAIIAASGDANAVASDGNFWGANTAFRADSSAFKEDLSYNIEKGKELVKKAEELNGGPIGTLKITGNTTKSINMSMCLIMQQECAKIGLKVEIDETDSAGILARTNYQTPGDFDIIQYNVPLEDWASAINRMFEPTSSNNRDMINDDYITNLIREAAAISDTATRAKMYEDLQVYVHDNAIYVPAYYGSRDGVQRAGVQGIIWTDDGYPEFAYACIAK